MKVFQHHLPPETEKIVPFISFTCEFQVNTRFLQVHFCSFHPLNCIFSCSFKFWLTHGVNTGPGSVTLLGYVVIPLRVLTSGEHKHQLMTLPPACQSAPSPSGQRTSSGKSVWEWDVSSGEADSSPPARSGHCRRGSLRGAVRERRRQCPFVAHLATSSERSCFLQVVCGSSAECFSSSCCCSSETHNHEPLFVCF